MTDYTALSDIQLQQLAVSGDRLAEDELAARYMQLVRACSRPLFLAGGESEDLVQEGTFGLVSAIRQYDPEAGASFKTFAERCIKMRLLSAIRSASRLKHFPLNTGVSIEQVNEASDNSPSAFPEVFWSSPEDLVLARESKEELYCKLLNGLSRFEKKVLNLYLDGLSYSDIAKCLDKDQKSVDNAVQRIRRKLARTITSGEISIS